MNKYLDVFISFAKVGVMTFGGGYAMLPILQREVVENKAWATDEELTDYYAIGQCTPGVIAVNTATFVGTKVKGALGGAVATVAVVCPSLIIITLISSVLKNFSEIEIVQHAFAGIRVAVGVLIIGSVWKLYKKGVKGALANGIFAAALLLVALMDISPVWVVLAALLLGIVLTWKGKQTA